jgi:predicted flavoprotein YhiN
VQKSDVSELMGLSLSDVGLVAKYGGKAAYRDFGDVIFTHFGISEPVALRAGAHLTKSLHLPHEFYLDFAPNQSE